MSGDTSLVDDSSFLTPLYTPDSAWTEHAPFAFWLVGRLRPRLIVELGVHHGFSYFTFCQAVVHHRTSTRCVGIDTWAGDEHSGYYHESVHDTVAEYNHRSYSSFSTLIRSTFDEAISTFADRSVDLLHVDGRHFYEDVMHDVTTWLPKLSDSGVILLHDTNVHERGFGVARYFRELATDYPVFEFMHGNGLGLAYVGTIRPSPIDDLLRRGGEVSGQYATLGAGISARVAAADRDAVRQELDRVEAALQDRTAAAESSQAACDAVRQELDRVEAALQERTAAAAAAVAGRDLAQGKLLEVGAFLQESRHETERLTREARDLQQLASRQDEAESALRAELAAQGQLVAALTTSTSWRVTAPARSVMRRLRIVAPSRLIWRLARTAYHALPLSMRRKSQLRALAIGRLSTRIRPTPMASTMARIRGVTRGGTYQLGLTAPGDLVVHPFLSGDRGVLDTSVSIVIPTYNAGPEFYWLLRRLRTQSGLRSLEIVVVDSGSTDDTVRIATTFDCVIVTIPNSEFTHSHARNLGAKAARGDLLLFTVQDAYPIGDRWVYGLARGLLEPRDGVRLAAVSCAEFPRADSELMYDAMIDTHYRFLGCHDRDRLGSLNRDDHESLRSQGQLSDVACMISRAMFMKYLYEGSYAEDLKLGIRLLRDGYTIAMLSSIKVIHSHHRTPSYYLRRSFTDVAYLRDTFPDFPILPIRTLLGGLIGGQVASAILDQYLDAIAADAPSPAAALDRVAAQFRHASIPVNLADDPLPDFGVPSLRAWADDVMQTEEPRRRITHDEREDADALLAGVASRLVSIRPFAERVYPTMDDVVRRQVVDTVQKSVAASVGIQFGYAVMRTRVGELALDRAFVERIARILSAGV